MHPKSEIGLWASAATTGVEYLHDGGGRQGGSRVHINSKNTVAVKVTTLSFPWAVLAVSVQVVSAVKEERQSLEDILKVK